MRRALARLLTLVLTLSITAVAALFALVTLAPRTSFGRPPWPLYFNPAPRNVHDLARRAAERLRNHQDEHEAALTLVHLGGAALPHILPLLDELPPSERGNLAVALAPLARRMGIGADEALSDPEVAAAFWQRFWQDREFDFRPQIARRLVSRMAQKSNSLRRDDLSHLDSFALPELFATLGSIRTRVDVERAARLTTAIERVLGQGRVARTDSSVAEAREIVREWQAYWTENGADFVTLDGPQRVMALFAQTRMGHWLSDVISALRNPETDADVTEVGLPRGAAAASALRLLLAWFAALGLALAWVWLELIGARALRQVSQSCAALATVALPLAVGLLKPPSSEVARQLLLIAVCCVVLGVLLSRHALAAHRGAALPKQGGLRTVLGELIASTPACLSWAFAASFCLELELDLKGVAGPTLAALGSGEIGPAMALALGGALLASVWLTVARRAPSVLAAPSRTPALVIVEQDQRVLWFGLGAALSCAVLGALTARVNIDERGLSELALAARSFFYYGGVSALIAASLGLALGALAASGPSSLDWALAIAVEVATSLPALFWLAAANALLDSGLACAVAAGALRALDIAWLLRTELLRRARIDEELATRSLGRLPLQTYLQQRLRPAMFPALTAVALTPAWTLAIGVAGRLCALPASAGDIGWTRMFSRVDGQLLTSVGAVALLIVPTWLLVSTLTRVPRPLGAFRSNPPPANEAPLEPD